MPVSPVVEAFVAEKIPIVPEAAAKELIVAFVIVVVAKVVVPNTVKSPLTF